MGPLIFMARRHQIKRKKSNLQYRLMQVQNQRQQIAARVGETQQRQALKQSVMTVNNQMRTANMKQQMYQKLQNEFGQNSYNGIAQNCYNIFASLGQTVTNPNFNGNYQAALNNMQAQLDRENAFNTFLSQMGDQSDQAELGALHVLDSQLEQEQTSLENQLKLLEAEEQAVEKQMDQEIKNSAPKFGLSG